MFVDTHTHLYLPEFDTDGGGIAAVGRALDAGVDKMIFPNVDLSTAAPLLTLHSRFPDQTFVAKGLHPTEVNSGWREAQKSVMESFAATRCVAIGEIGIDLYWDKTYRDEQMKCFREQCLMALDQNLPVIIHCREGLQETLEVLSSLPEVPHGVFHSFGGTEADIDSIRSVGDFYFGINGIVTFKNSTLPSVLPAIGIDRILLETDSPYLAPVPKRGRRNESAFVPHIAAKVGETLGLSAEEVGEITTDNAHSLFGI